MKKIISLLLVFTMLFSLVILASCGKDDNGGTTATTQKPKPTDPVELVKDTFSQGKIYQTISDVKKPVEDIKGKVDEIKAVKVTNTVSINKLNVGGNAILPSPLVLSGELKTDKKSLSLDGKLSFVGDELSAKIYAATASGKALDDKTLDPEDITVTADLGDLYEGPIGLDGIVKKAVSSAKEKMENGDAASAKAEEAMNELKDALNKYFSTVQVNKIASDLSGAVEKALEQIPANAFENSKGTLKYKDVYTADGANISVLTIDEVTASKISVAFLTYLKDKSTSEALNYFKENADLEDMINEMTVDPEDAGENKLIVTISSNEEATLFDLAMKKEGEDQQKFITLFSKESGILCVDLYREGEAATFKVEKTDGKFEMSLNIPGEKPVEFKSLIEKKSEDNYSFETSLKAGVGEEAGTMSLTGSVVKTGDKNNGTVTGDLKFSVDIPKVKAEIPVSLKIERLCRTQTRRGRSRYARS